MSLFCPSSSLLGSYLKYEIMPCIQKFEWTVKPVAFKNIKMCVTALRGSRIHWGDGAF